MQTGNQTEEQAMRNIARLQRQKSLNDESFVRMLKEVSDKRSQRIMKKKLLSFHGKNYVAKYQDKFNFMQQWEDKRKEPQFGFDIGIPNSKVHEVLFTLLYPIFMLSVFVTSLDYFFKTTGPRDLYTVTYCLTILGFTLDAVRGVHSYLTSRQTIYYDFWEIISQVYMQIFTCAYFALKIMDIPGRKDWAWAFLEIFVTIYIIKCINRIEYTYRFLRFLMGIQNQAKVVEIYIGLLIILHIMATALICSTYSYPDNNWLSSLTIDYSNEFTVYLRAFYFATTTILTVGYGDISPKNDLEIVVVTVIEMFGIVVFAYMINEIGHSMSNLRKEKEIIDRDLSDVQKIKLHYKMKEETTNRLRTFVINQKATGNLLQPESQQTLMSKLNQQLRQEVQKENNLSIAKTSLFFLMRWSKDFQKQVAKRLEHVLFSPNQLLYQPSGKERIYVMRVGKVNLHAERSRMRKSDSTPLKTIEVQLGSEKYNNTYGWTTVLSKRASNLFAYAKVYTSAYFIDRGNFSQCIKPSSTDLQYYHELNEVINHSKCSEALQLPILQSSKHHFNPTKAVVLKRDRERTAPQVRKFTKRGSRKARKESIVRGMEEIEIFRRKSDRFISIKDMELQEETDENTGNWSEQAQRSVGFDLIKLTVGHIEDIDPVVSHFESAKEFSNYFVRHNPSVTLLKLESSNWATSTTKLNQDLNKSLYYPQCQLKSRLSGKTKTACLQSASLNPSND